MESKKPKLNLTGTDGNVFGIIGKCCAAAKKANWPQDKIKEMTRQMMSGDYDNLLKVAMEHFDVS